MWKQEFPRRTPQHPRTQHGFVAQLAERPPEKWEVTGSTPVETTTNAPFGSRRWGVRHFPTSIAPDTAPDSCRTLGDETAIAVLPRAMCLRRCERVDERPALDWCRDRPRQPGVRAVAQDRRQQVAEDLRVPSHIDVPRPTAGRSDISASLPIPPPVVVIRVRCTERAGARRRDKQVGDEGEKMASDRPDTVGVFGVGVE